jgi:hypothetical protein
MLACLSTLSPQLSAAPLGTAFSYQGRLAEGVAPATGLFDLRFAICDSSNGPTVLATVTNSAVPVTNGLFNVTLDFGPTAFDGSARWLDIGVRTNGSGLDYVSLVPRQPVTPTPYAIHAGNAGMLNGVGGTNYVAKAGDTMTGTLNLAVNGLRVGSSQLVAAGGNIGIGTTSPAESLHTTGSIYAEGGIFLKSVNGDKIRFIDNSGSGFGLYNPIGNEALYIVSGRTYVGQELTPSTDNSQGLGSPDSRWGYLRVGTGPSTFEGNVGIGTTSPQAKLDVAGAVKIGGTLSSDDRLHIQAGERLYLNPRGGFGDVYIGGDVGSPATQLIVPSGNVGIGTTSPQALLDVRGSSIIMGALGIGTMSPAYHLDLGGGTTVNERIRVQRGSDDASQYATFGWTGIYLHRDNVDLSRSQNSFGIHQVGSDGTRTLFWIDNSGNVGIGTTSPRAKLDVGGNLNVGGSDARHVLSAGASLYDYGSVGYGFAFTDTPGAHTYVLTDYASRLNFEDGGFKFHTAPQGTPGQPVPFTTVVTIKQSGNVGIGTTAPQAKLHVSGEILTKAVNITAGADISEPFPVTGPDISKGAVVVIDDTQPGQLKLSERAYDTRVAGIVSGAGGVNSGLTLRQEGALEGNHNVALTGRVYALADASTSPIKPGDMLTTSDTPGHVMKAADRAKAYGAVIGKAMTPLKEGQGLVLVLVSLQ